MMDAALRAISEPTRREILRLVWSEERAAGDIASHFRVTRAAVSQHLRVLSQSGLVTSRSAGTRRVYAVSPEGLGALRTWMDEFWARALDGFRAAAEDAARSEAARE